MASPKSSGLVSELESFLEKLKSYQGRLEYLRESKTILGHQLRERDELRERLMRKTGALKSIVIELTGREQIQRFGIVYNIWSTALSPHRVTDIPDIALDYCIDAVTEGIGKLESDIENGIRDEQGNVIGEPQKLSSDPPKAFISHGRKSVALNKLTEFLETLGIEPLIVKKQPSLNKTIDDKVEYYLNQADFVIILATGDDEVKGKLHPRQNIIHEIGLAQKTHPGRIIYLLEEGTEFPSNIRPKVWESFKHRNMMNAFLGIVRELRAYDMLKVIKPQE